MPPRSPAPNSLLRTSRALVALALPLAACGVPRPRLAPATARSADAIAHRMQDAVDTAAWERTGAVRWTFFGGRHHLWDRARDYERVRFDHFEVQLDLGARRGLAWRDGARVPDPEAAALVDRAHGYWTNDSFWLNPVAKVFDGGTVRTLARTSDGREGLLVTYTTGGRTPGDRYLWLLSSDFRPRSWRMWVSILPVGGAEVSWEDWRPLATGAWIAHRHRTLVLDLRLTGVAGAATLSELEPGADPFAPLAEALRAGTAVAAAAHAAH